MRAFFIVVSLFAGVAAAQERLPSFALTRFSLNDAPAGGLTAATGDVLPARKLRLFGAFHYEHSPLVLYRDEQPQGALVGNRFGLHLGAGYGITSWLTVSAELPIVLHQNGDDLHSLVNVAAPDSAGLGSPRLAARLSILSQRKGGLVKEMPFDLAFQIATAFPVGLGNALAVESGWNVFPQLSLGRDFGGLRLGAEVVGLIRPSAVSLSQLTVQDQIGSQLGVRALVATSIDIVRLEASFHTVVPLGSATPLGFELLGGARLPIGPIEIFVIAGPGFGTQPGTPTVRVLGGVGIRPDDTDPCSPIRTHTPAQCPELDDDADQIVNRADACPLEPEDIDRFKDTDGCPEPDNDGDGVFDTNDRCPLERGPLANRGCPVVTPKPVDTDGDGVVDSNDECPTEAGPAERKGCPLKDRDGDGVVDADDACPELAGPVERKGCPLQDKDNDGVEDHFDNCRDEAGPASNQGCPEKNRQLVIITNDKLVIKDKVYFATGKATILGRSFPLLNNVARVLREHEELQLVRIEGHTDAQGSRELNTTLSQRRANSVKDYLIHQGVDGTRLQAKGFGPDRPADTNATEAGRTNNRRVEFVIRAPGAPQE